MQCRVNCSGETYLPIEPLATSHTVGSDLSTVAREYRGGGTLPRHSVTQQWLEASLQPEEEPGLERSRDRGSRRSIFRSSRRLEDILAHNRPERAGGAQGLVEAGAL